MIIEMTMVIQIDTIVVRVVGRGHGQLLLRLATFDFGA